ncbi:MAG: M23 family metallopeptidase [Betaproteobacteria bacterium]|jgi:murein DD-endopeptidase MepM/ murein hydrolase activator NlpD|nr:MAG: M23 family metallopeptidase [Betaproteobacteria bacterium]
MDIILVSDRFDQARSFRLSKPQIFFLCLLFLSLVLSLSVLLNYFSLRYAVEHRSPYLQSLLVAVQEEQTKRTQSYLRESLNTMAARVGEMQARLLLLDTLGERLGKLAGLDPKEFVFEQTPARGGPSPERKAKPLSFTELNEQLDTLAGDLDDRSDKLGALESRLFLDYAKQQFMPTSLPVENKWFSSNFGWRIDPFTGFRTFHEGIDFVSRAGRPIRAAGAGVVVYSGSHPQYGNMVEVDHGNGLVTRYAHASSLDVKVGDVVVIGQKIAEVGSTGRSTGPHLHFEVRVRGVAVNPKKYLQKNSRTPRLASR